MSITVCNFTNVYENQPFMEGLRRSGEATWIDCTDIPGTDCHCDDEAVVAIRKRIARTVPLEDAAEPSFSHVEEEVEARARNTALMEAVDALGEPDATILIQKYFYRRKMADIGRMVGLTANAAQVRCSRALKRLRRMLEEV